MDRRTAMLLMGLGAASAATRLPLSSANAKTSDSTLFCGDFESGNVDQFKSIDLSGGRVRPKIISTPTRTSTSRFACQYQLSGKQFRCEMVPAYSEVPYVATEGSDLYYGWSVFFSEDFPRAPWQVCGQWHHTDLFGKGKFDSLPPPMAFYIVNGDKTPRWRLANNGQNPWGVGWSVELGPLPTDSWADVVVHAKFSTVPSECLVEVWINGELKGTLVPPVPILYPTETDAPRVSYLKIGYYRDPRTSTPGSVIFDEVAIGMSYDSVASKKT